MDTPAYDSTLNDFWTYANRFVTCTKVNLGFTSPGGGDLGYLLDAGPGDTLYLPDIFSLPLGVSYVGVRPSTRGTAGRATAFVRRQADYGIDA